MSAWFLVTVLHLTTAIAAAAGGPDAGTDSLPDQFAFAGDVAVVSVHEADSSGDDVFWEFGDGGTGEGRVAQHTYREPGVYLATARLGQGVQGGRVVTQKVHVKPGYDIDQPLPYRGVLISHTHGHMNFPWGRVDIDAAERPNSFYDPAEWESTLDRLAGWGFNRICFLDKHPYPYLVRVPGFPEAQAILDEELERNRTAVRTVLRLARERGMGVDMLVYNIHTPEPVCRKYGFDEHEDNPISRRYTAAAVGAFYRDFDGFGGLILTVGESPPGCVDFCRQAYIGPMLAVEPTPGLILRDQMLDADDTFRLTGGLAEWHVLAKMTEEQYLGDALSALGWLHHRRTGRRTIYLQSSHSTGLLDGSYSQVRGLVAQVRRARGQGVLVQMAEDRGDWLALAAFGYYMARGRTTGEQDQRYFAGLIRDRFGDGVPVEELLEAGDAAGRILPAVRRQFYSRNWHYQAEFGLFMDQMMSMPTASSFDHYNSGGEGFTHWLPRAYRYQKDLATMREAVNTEPGNNDAHGPGLLVAQLREYAGEIDRHRSRLRALRPGKGGDVWERQLDDLDCLSALACFYASKSEACLAWGRWARGTEDGQEAAERVARLLDNSIDAYRRAQTAYALSHPQPDRILMVAGGDASGWSYAGAVQGGMRAMLSLFELERDVIADRMRRGERTLPTFLELQRRDG